MLKHAEVLPIPRTHLILVVAISLLVGIAFFLAPQSADGVTATVPIEAEPVPEVTEAHSDALAEPPSVADEPSIEEADLPVVEPAEPEKKVIEVTVAAGDTLSTLFDQYGIGQSVLYQILSADEALLALETIRTGQKLYFRFDDSGDVLEEMELFQHAGSRVVYRRAGEQGFEYDEIIIDGDWITELVSGEIINTFYLSSQKAGLSEFESAVVTRIFQDQLNFTRSIQAGDKFQVLRSVQFIDGQPTGQTRIEGARIQRRAHEHTAFLNEDGSYYDASGESLARAFRRLPLAQSYRISSAFNPRRIHPVTGLVSPHNGTDFATPTGTPVLSTGDGVVTMVGNHPFAGRYIEIQHGGQYKTRYLHLNRILVSRGETVTRGQRIALSGNTGRSTGPHLHFELHVNGRPVNAMTANIPMAESIPKEQAEAFAQLVERYTRELNAEGEARLVVANSP